MILLDSLNLFSSGPCALRVNPWPRAVESRAIPGLDGEILLAMGRRSRTLRQTGRLQAESMTQLQDLIDAIADRQDSELHILTDSVGRAYLNLWLESFDLNTPLLHGRQYYCDYEILYRQLP